jgi:hypothetical protein
LTNRSPRPTPSTGGGDARYDVDFPARDHVLVEQLRNKGAIIFAKAYNGRPDALSHTWRLALSMER